MNPGHAVIHEAQRAGSQVIDVGRAGDAQVFLLETQGARHLYAQPYVDGTALPGEHHAWLHGSWPAACALERGVARPRWTAPHDGALERWLTAESPTMAQLAASTSFDYAIGTGSVPLDWALQLTSLGDGRSHLVMQAGRYADDGVGIAHFVAAARTIGSSIGPRPPQARQQPLYPVAHGATFERVLLGGTPLAALSTQSSPPVSAPTPPPPPPPAPRARKATPTGQTNRDLNIAGGLLFDERYEEAIQVYRRIAEAHADARGICYAQIGSALYFLGRYREAIHWYEAAVLSGADPTTMGRNIAEAQQLLRV
jgi:tetratricopeptide (TPR) repeat protein